MLNKTMLSNDEMVIGLMLEQLAVSAHYVLSKQDNRSLAADLLDYVVTEVMDFEDASLYNPGGKHDGEWALAVRDGIMEYVLDRRTPTRARIMTLLVSAIILLNVEGGRVTMMPSLVHWFYTTSKTNPRLAAHWLIDGWFRDYTAQGLPWRATELAHMYDPGKFERL